MSLIKGADEIYYVRLFKDNNQYDILNDSSFSETIIEIYDSSDVLIQQYAYPTKVDYEELTISGNIIQFSIFGSNTTGKASGNMKYKRIIKLVNSSFPDSTYDGELIIDDFDILIDG